MRHPDDEDDNGELDDRELPDPADAGDDDDEAEADTEPCPYCGKAVYYGADVCPHCRSFISAEDAPPRRRPAWLVVGALLALLAMLSGVILFLIG